MRATPTILPLRLRDVSFVAGGRTLLHGIDLNLSGADRTIVMGHNGAGKSLLLRLCHGLLAPSHGEIAWMGPGAALQPRRHAMVFQRPVMLRRSAFANLVHALSIAGLGREARHRRAQEALDRFGLGALAARPARVLSGGEQQRLALARAWALLPEVLFLDEPTSNLDPAATRAVEDMIQAFTADGIKVVMTTHDIGQAHRLADEVVFLHGGHLIEHTTADKFFTSPRSPEASAFLRGDLLV